MSREYKCRFCSKSFRSMYGLKTHLKTEHPFRYYLPRIILPAILSIIIVAGLSLSMGLRLETPQTTTQSTIIQTSTTSIHTTLEAGFKTAPEFILPEYGSGRRLGIGNFSGKPIFLEFFSPYCPHCLKMMPIVEKLYEKYNDRIVFIMVSYGEKGVGEVIEKYGLKPIVLIDEDGGVFEKYKVEGVPTFYILDKNHRIYSSIAGETVIEELESVIREVI